MRSAPSMAFPYRSRTLIDVAGLPARYGSLTMKDNVARADAPSVERLRRAGAIILGKTATPEYGYPASPRAWCTASPVIPGISRLRRAAQAAARSLPLRLA